VQRFVQRWKAAKSSPALTQAYVPLSFSPGEVCQFNWSHKHVELARVMQTIKGAYFRLTFSRLMFVVTYPRETQEMVFDAHNRAFSFFGGVPQRMVYDNLKAIVETIFTGTLRIPTQGGQVFQPDRGHHSNLIAATLWKRALGRRNRLAGQCSCGVQSDIEIDGEWDADGETDHAADTTGPAAPFRGSCEHPGNCPGGRRWPHHGAGLPGPQRCGGAWLAAGFRSD
jgi:hypothetical protein